MHTVSSCFNTTPHDNSFISKTSSLGRLILFSHPYCIGMSAESGLIISWHAIFSCIAICQEIRALLTLTRAPFFSGHIEFSVPFASFTYISGIVHISKVHVFPPETTQSFTTFVSTVHGLN